MRRSPQRGFSLAILLAVLALVAISLLAMMALSRFADSTGDRATTERRLSAAANALEQFAASSQRLPCPANPQLASTAANAGDEVRKANNIGCQFPAGTLPWKTIGLRSEDAHDAWGRKLSYRVFAGSGPSDTGSLAQAEGISMVWCDSWRLTGGSALTASGLCDPAKTTDASTFSAVGRLTVKDRGVDHGKVAYVILSHGATGLGGWTVAGTQLALPKSDERDHTGGSGPFHIKAFSDAETKADGQKHFDDLLLYAQLSDVVKRAGLTARNWPEAPPPGSTRFDEATIETATGREIAANSTGEWFIDFGPFRAFGLDSFGNVIPISYDTPNSTPGIGIGGANPMMTWSEREWLGLLFDTTFRKFGITLNEFRIFSQSGVQMAERVAFYFYRNGNPVGSFTRAACRSDQGLASFDIDVGTNYDAVIIEPLASTGVSSGSTVTGDSGFLVSELRTCGATEAFCRTFLSTPENSCVVSPDLRITKASGTLTAGSNGSYTINIDNVLGAASTNGAITVVDTLPAGLTYVSASGSGWSCSASGQVVTCTSTTSILPGNTGASLTINVAVGASAVPAVTNVATVSGGGEDGSLAANNTVIVSSTVNP